MLTILLIPSAIVILLLLLLFFAKDKGELGETAVSRELNRLDSSFSILNDLMIQNENASTSQIDHVVLSEYGIFVIETKNFQGWIFGKEQSEQWTQVIYHTKIKFRNPVKQNWSHIYALKNTLKDFPNIRYIPIVAFVGSATLKDVTSKTPIVYASDLLMEIQNQCSCEKSLSPENIAKIKEILLSGNIVGKKERKAHVREIQKATKMKEYKAENLICPKCNGTLILRESKYGKFYGCSNYPYCKFTMEIKP